MSETTLEGDFKIVKGALETMRTSSHYPAYAHMASDAVERLEERFNSLMKIVEAQGKALSIITALPVEKRLSALEAEIEILRTKNGSMADRLEKGASELRDAWKAEDRLRSVLRLLWEEATNEERCANERAPGCYAHAFSQPCRAAVEAALKEGDQI